MTNEVWKDIPGYEGKYQASTLGRIKSLSRNVVCKNGTRTIRERILKPARKRLYCKVDLGKRNPFDIHRLVAMTFIPNPTNLPQVNHIDGNKQNNKLSNLEWCNQSQNQLHAYKIGLQEPYSTGSNHCAISVLNMDNIEVDRFDSVSECARKMNLRKNSIFRVLRGVRHHYHKLKFKRL